MRAFLKTCKERAQHAPEKVLDFLKQWNEAHLLIILVLLWRPFSWLLVQYDPSSAPLDFGVLHKGYLGAVYYAGFSLMVWVGAKINAPVIYRFWEGLSDQFPNFTDTFKNLTAWQKILTLLIYLGLQFYFASACLQAAAQSN